MSLITCFILYWSHRTYVQIWVQGYQPVHYLQTSQPNSDPWRWRKPHPKLRIPDPAENRPGLQDEPTVSRLVFRPEFRIADLIGPLAGLMLMAGAGGFLSGVIVAGTHLFWGVVIALLLFGLGLYCFCRGDRVLCIELYPDWVVIIARFAVFLPRTTRYRPQQILGIKGQRQSFWTMEKTQLQPDYKLLIQRSLLGSLRITQTFRLKCDPTQGSWIVGGLQHWQESQVIRQ